jgi:hypothetical protein
MPIATLVFWVLTVVAAVVLAFYVTYLFAHRLRRRKGVLKSFGTWLRDLFDVASGIG